MKKIYEFDGNKIKTLDSFYECVSEVLIPGFVWGKNLDAFNDILGGGFGTPEEGFIIRWKNSDQSKENLGYPETLKYLENGLLRCHPSNRDIIKKKIELARNSQGETLFEIIVEVILDNKSYVELELS